MMPCSWAVYELDDGSVWLATMNIGMMSRMFAGDVAAGMGEVAAATANDDVSPAERRRTRRKQSCEAADPSDAVPERNVQSPVSGR